MSNEDKVFDAIKSIISEKKEAKRVPNFALFIEVTRKVDELSKEEINIALRGLYKAKKIIAGNTINDKWIDIVE